MILEQFYLEQLAQASYLIGDPAAGIAVVVDPRRDVDVYLDAAAAQGMRIEHVLLTHFHADFVSGHIELQARTGATIHLGAKADPEFAFHPLDNGERLEFGSVRLEILETPGHTPESISILVFNLDESAETPKAVLTGDTLFNGDVGRPDLLASVNLSPQELASKLYDSLREKLLPLADEVVVYPGHGAGSACGKNMSTETWTTMGAQRQSNYALQPISREEFVRQITEGQTPPPSYFAHDVRLNRSQHETLDTNLKRALRPLNIAELLAEKADGVTVLDGRDAEAFAENHLADSINVPLSGRFCSWAGTLLDPMDRFAIIAEPNGEREAAIRLGRVGFDNVVGFLKDGAPSLGQEPSCLRRTELPTPADLDKALSSSQPPVVLDVRTRREWNNGRIRGSLNVPLQELLGRLGDVPLNLPMIVHCETGYRSTIAASMLRANGGEDVGDLAGGIVAWQQAGYPTISALSGGVYSAQSMANDTASPRARNLDAVLAAETAGDGRLDAFPLRVTLELTADCNLRCPHCEFTPPRAWKDKHDPGRILHTSLEDLTRFAGDVFPHVQEIIPSVVGEPMMYPFWNEFLALAREHGVFVELITNGTYLDDKTLPPLEGLATKLIVSMDGASASTFNYLRQPCDFDDVCERLECVRDWRARITPQARPNVWIASVLTLQWVDELPEMVRLAHKLGIDGLSVGHLIAYNSHWQESHPSKDKERTDRALRVAADEGRRLGVSVNLPRLFGNGEDVSHDAPPHFEIATKVDEPPPQTDKRHYCKYAWREAFIALNGDVSPCCGNSRPVIDNLRQNYDFKAILNNPTYVSLREGLVTGDLHPACAQCPQLAMYGNLDYGKVDFDGTYGAMEGLRV
ncbi:MAG: hypothetical protein CMJ85_01780 [Planctomycetes bacterium]|jgi:glyoxylase-like metal-dependent hydrolase (beta-lactamase superfamily II)/rhodanese-related sulfurtransferase/MoaA/NifB/PqqE/SkfB family radical SAM enzyme|nr:hypothetical protein [Planctomycetota bacterium]